MSVKAGRVFAPLAFFALAAVGIYYIAKHKESNDTLSQKCTDLGCKINDLQSDIDILYEELETHRAALRTTPHFIDHGTEEIAKSTSNSLEIIIESDAAEDSYDLVGSSVN